MLQIDPTLIGRKFYSHDPNTVYICRGVVISGTLLVIGELTDGTYSRLTTHKLTDVKFPIPVATAP
jgi:hypothetical protein